ncbi:MAG: VTT domain-containing protein, partial [Deltaproteobacteria bacterium]|nr:VTT domain-containing protein [Deltaproteobacteria bacterium]
QELMGKFEYLVERHGAFFTFILFLIPGIPKDSLCYLLGLSPMHVFTLLVISCFGRIPGTLLLTMQGSSVRSEHYRSFFVVLATISWFCREFQKANPAIRIETKIHIQENDVANPVKTVIYRVMQEAFNNISKHSKANLVNLTLQKEENKIEFIIQDHGQGFDLNAVYSLKSSEKGLGLAGMKERTFLSGGSFSIQSTRGIGTTIRASWPISA